MLISMWKQSKPNKNTACKMAAFQSPGHYLFHPWDAGTGELGYWHFSMAPWDQCPGILIHPATLSKTCSQHFSHKTVQSSLPASPIWSPFWWPEAALKVNTNSVFPTNSTQLHHVRVLLQTLTFSYLSLSGNSPPAIMQLLQTYRGENKQSHGDR